MMSRQLVFVNLRRRRRPLRLLDLARPEALLRLALSLLHGAAAGLLAQGVLLALAAGLAQVGVWRGWG